MTSWLNEPLVLLESGNPVKDIENLYINDSLFYLRQLRSTLDEVLNMFDP